MQDTEAEDTQDTEGRNSPSVAHIAAVAQGTQDRNAMCYHFRHSLLLEHAAFVPSLL
jgi:hypothetical protein